METSQDCDSEPKSIRKSESFTSLILRTLPSCWRRPEELESDDGGFSDHHLRTKRVTVTHLEEFSSLPTSPIQSQSEPRSEHNGVQTKHNSLRTSLSSPIQLQGRPSYKHRRILRKSGKYSVNQPVLEHPYGREFYSDKKLLQHYSSCHTFRQYSSAGSSGQVVYRRPHSVDLGGVGRSRISQSKGFLQQEFRRVGIGTCLEGGSLFTIIRISKNPQ